MTEAENGDGAAGPVRVLIIDDHAVVRAGIRRLLEASPGFEVVGDGPHGGVAPALVAEYLPDVVLMDLSMPVVDGIEATRSVLAVSPEVAVLILTSSPDREDVLRALDAGAAGYILKDCEPEDLIAAVRSAAAGNAPLDPRAARALLSDRRQAAAPDTGPSLSQREREVLEAVGRGLPNKLVARELGIAEKTVKAHLTRIYGLIGVTDRTQAALWVRQQGGGEQPR